jgi:hypothetical protein
MNSPVIQIPVKRYGPSGKSIDNFEYKIQTGWVKKTEKSSGVSILVWYTSRQEMKKIQKMTVNEVWEMYTPLDRVRYNEKV